MESVGVGVGVGGEDLAENLVENGNVGGVVGFDVYGVDLSRSTPIRSIQGRSTQTRSAPIRCKQGRSQ